MQTNTCKVQDCSGTFHHFLLHKPKRSPNEQVLRNGSKNSKHKDEGCDVIKKRLMTTTVL